MSSQTTDTPGTTTTNISVADRSGATFQTYPILEVFANSHFCDLHSSKKVPAVIQRANLRTIFRLFRRGSVAFFPHQRRRLELLYTPGGPGTNPPAEAVSWGENPELARIPGPRAPPQSVHRQNVVLCSASQSATMRPSRVPPISEPTVQRRVSHDVWVAAKQGAGLGPGAILGA